MKLQHVLTEQNEYFTDDDDIRNWLHDNYVYDYIIHDDLTVSVHDRLNFTNFGLYHIPVKFKRVGSNVDCASNNLTDLHWAPEIVGGYFNCTRNKLKTFEGISKHIKETIYCNGNPFISFKNIHKMTSCTEVMLPHTPVIGTLYWLLVPNLAHIDVSSGNSSVYNILNKHLKTKDILACQDDLISAGFPEWAKV